MPKADKPTDEKAEFDLAVQAAGGWRSYCLDLAKAHVHEATDAISSADWLRVEILLKLAVDYIADSGVCDVEQSSQANRRRRDGRSQ